MVGDFDDNWEVVLDEFKVEGLGSQLSVSLPVFSFTEKETRSKFLQENLIKSRVFDEGILVVEEGLKSFGIYN